MPDILPAHYKGSHISFVCNSLAQCDKLIICSRFCPAVFIKIGFIINNAIGIFSAKRHCIYFPVKGCGGSEKGHNLVGQRFQFSSPDIHSRVSHFHNIREFPNAVLRLNKFTVSAAISRLNCDSNVRICFIKSVHDFIHGGLCPFIAVCKDKGQLCRCGNNPACVLCCRFCFALGTFRLSVIRL